MENGCARIPYAPSIQPVQVVNLPTGPSLFRWRAYLILHLLVVAATSAMTIAEGANDDHRNNVHDAIIPWGIAMTPIAVFGILMAYAPPVVIVVLLVKSTRHGLRFVLAAGAEVILMLAHFYALLPLVQ